MTRAEALKKAARLLRKPLTELYYNEAGDAARDEETRLAALEKCRATGNLIRNLIEQRTAHVKMILDADPTYQTMTLLIDAEKKYQKEQNAIAQYRCTVGTVDRTIPIRRSPTMDDRRKPMSPFAGMIFDSLMEANRRAAEQYQREGQPSIIGYAIEMPPDWPHPSILVCTKPTCQPGNPATVQERIPLTQVDIDFLALTAHKAQHCESCGAWLSTYVKGPDPRD